MSASLQNQGRAQQAFDLELRTLAVLDFASLLATDALEGSLDDPLESFIDDAFRGLNEHPSIVPITEAFRQFEGSLEDAVEYLQRRNIDGLAVQFATPVRNYRTENRWHSGWSHYGTEWVYASSFEEAWLLGVAWAEEAHAADLAEFIKEKQGGAA